MPDERDHLDRDGEDSRRAGEAYEPPALEDLDTSEGSSVTAAGAPTQVLAAPREL